MNTRLRAESAAHPSPTALKPCAFCDSTKRLDFDFVEFNSDDIRVYCADCSAEGPRGKTEAEAIAAWNRRASEAELVAALAEVMEWIDGWETPFTLDDEWPATRAKARAALAKHGS